MDPLHELQLDRLTELGRREAAPLPPHQPRLNHRTIDTYWVTREGVYMRMSTMKYSHLCNTIRMVRRNWSVNRYRMSTPSFPMMNGDMAQMFAEQDWEQECDRRVAATSILEYDRFVGLVREHTLRLIQTRRDLRTQRLIAEIMSGERFFV